VAPQQLMLADLSGKRRKICEQFLGFSSMKQYHAVVPSYVIGITSAFLTPIQDAWAVILDSYFSNRILDYHSHSFVVNG
jgi:hypothetical protein